MPDEGAGTEQLPGPMPGARRPCPERGGAGITGPQPEPHSVAESQEADLRLPGAGVYGFWYYFMIHRGISTSLQRVLPKYIPRTEADVDEPELLGPGPGCTGNVRM